MRNSRRREQGQWRQLYAIPTKFARGYLEFLSIVTRDVVERKRSETELDLIARFDKTSRGTRRDAATAD